MVKYVVVVRLRRYIHEADCLYNAEIRDQMLMIFK